MFFDSNVLLVIVEAALMGVISVFWYDLVHVQQDIPSNPETGQLVVLAAIARFILTVFVAVYGCVWAFGWLDGQPIIHFSFVQLHLLFDGVLLVEVGPALHKLPFLRK
jgi:hypothetical protein